MKRKIKAVVSSQLSGLNQFRYCLVDLESNEVIDDCQGKGYQSAYKAHRAYAYKHQTRVKKAKRQQREKEILKWMYAHPEAIRKWNLIAKERKLDANDFSDIVKDNEMESRKWQAKDLLKVWNTL